MVVVVNMDMAAGASMGTVRGASIGMAAGASMDSGVDPVRRLGLVL